MEQIENEKIPVCEFYSELEKIVRERIADLIADIRIFENIDRSRGLFGYEKAKKTRAGIALAHNEKFMLFFDKDFLNLQ